MSNDRKLGLLMPISSLPSAYGIGSLGKGAKNFVDFLVKSGAKCWQILPIGPTGYGDSPYQSFSCFAGNTYFIDLEMLKADKLLTAAELKKVEDSGDCIDYSRLYETREPLLRIAYSRFEKNIPDDFYAFCNEQTHWLSDYAMFMEAKRQNDGKPYQEWEEGLARHEPEAMGKFWHTYQDEINFYRFCQYVFYKQWFELKKYANDKGISIIGDMPIYVSADSTEAWAMPHLFIMGQDLYPKEVAGCPPDYFSEDGQLWGNPIYNWERHHQDGFAWWIDRIRRSLNIYDTVRIDHFRAFDTYYAIPFGSKTAKVGEWRNGPGMDLFNRVFECIDSPSVIAEDLGDLFDSVKVLLENSGFPGMKITQFAFDDADSSYLPHFHKQNLVVYTGTHDNATLMEFLTNAKKTTKRRMAEYFGCSEDRDDLFEGVMRATVASVADLAVIPIQDFMRMGKEGRINTPSTLGGNWQFRLKKENLTKELSGSILRLVKTYSR